MEEEVSKKKQMESVLAKLMGFDYNPPGKQPPSSPPYCSRQRRPPKVLSPRYYESMDSMNHHLLLSSSKDEFPELQISSWEEDPCQNRSPSVDNEFSGRHEEELEPAFSPNWTYSLHHSYSGGHYLNTRLSLSSRMNDDDRANCTSVSGKESRKVKSPYDGHMTGSGTGIRMSRSISPATESCGRRTTKVAKLIDSHRSTGFQSFSSGSGFKVCCQRTARQITSEVQENVWIKCLENLKRNDEEHWRVPQKMSNSDSCLRGPNVIMNSPSLAVSSSLSPSGKGTGSRRFSVHKDWCYNFMETGGAGLDDSKSAETEKEDSKSAETEKDDSKSAETEKDDSKSAETKEDDSKSAETEKDDSKSAETEEDDSISAETEEEDSKSAETEEMERFESNSDEIESVAAEKGETFGNRSTTTSTSSSVDSEDDVKPEVNMLSIPVEISSKDGTKAEVSCGMVQVDENEEQQEFLDAIDSEGDQWCLKTDMGLHSLTVSNVLKHETFVGGGFPHKNEEEEEQSRVKIEEGNNQDHFQYFVNVLSESGLDLESVEGKLVRNLSKQQVVAVDPLVFDKVEKLYVDGGKQKSSSSWVRSERKLLFDQINCKLTEVLDPYTQMVIMLQQQQQRCCSSRRGQDVVAGSKVKELWHIVVGSMNSSSSASSSELGKERNWVNAGEGMCSIVEELEKFLVDELVEEIILEILI